MISKTEENEKWKTKKQKYAKPYYSFLCKFEIEPWRQFFVCFFVFSATDIHIYSGFWYES